ncbi:hypothetical protein ACJX0J_010691, partial [Zea mays]
EIETRGEGEKNAVLGKPEAAATFSIHDYMLGITLTGTTCLLVKKGSNHGFASTSPHTCHTLVLDVILPFVAFFLHTHHQGIPVDLILTDTLLLYNTILREPA